VDPADGVSTEMKRRSKKGSAVLDFWDLVVSFVIVAIDW
jgi:hypothetical protein